MKPLLRCSFAIVVVFILSMMAQATTVTGTLVDSSGQVLINTKIHIEFQGPPGIPGSPTITPVDVQTDSNGGFTTTLTGNDTITPSRSTYTFTICPNATVPCSVIRQVSITGTSIDISSVLNAGISPTIINAQTLVPKAYKDTEVPVVDLTNIGAMYWNVIDKSIHLWDGTVWTALLSASSNNTLTGINTFKYINGVRNAAQFTSIQAAIDDAGNGGTVIVPSYTSATLTTGITISNSNVTLRCELGASINSGFNGTLLTITGNSNIVNGCTFDGKQASGFTGINISINGGTNNIISNNTIINSSSYGIYMFNGASKNKIRNNTVSGNLSIAIFGEKNADDNEVTDNFVNTAIAASGSHAIAFHGSLTGNTVNREKITGNKIEQGAAVGFCIEVGNFGGNISDSDTITNNKCIAVGTSAGGYSLSGVSNSTVGKNTYDVNGHTGTIAALEMVVTTGTTAEGNIFNGGTTLAKCMTLDRSTNNTVDNNICNGWSIASGAQGLHIVTNTAGISAGHNIVSNNQFIYPTGGTATKGIMVQVNNATADGTGNQLIGNKLYGNGVTNSNGILLERDAGTLAYTLVALNSYFSLDIAFNQASDDNTLRIGNIYGTGINTIVGGASTNPRGFDSGTITFNNGATATAGAATSVKLSSLQVGTNGTVVNTIITASATLTYTAIAAQTCQEQPVTVTNSVINNRGVQASPQADIGANLVYGGARVSVAGTVQVRVCNPTAGILTPTAVTWGVTVAQ